MIYRARCVIAVVLLAAVASVGCGASEPPDAYLSEDGVPYVRYQTIKHSTNSLGEVRLLPLPEALAEAEEDLGAPFAAPVADPMKVFPTDIFVRIDVPESAYAFGEYPTMHMEMILEPDFLSDGTVDPAQGSGKEADSNVDLEVKHPVDGLRPVSNQPLVEVESDTVGTVFVDQTVRDGRIKDVRFYWLDGNTQYMLEYFPSTATHTREEMLALVDLIPAE